MINFRKNNLNDSKNDYVISDVRASFSNDEQLASSWSLGCGAEMADGKPVVLYLHGNTGSRALNYRINTYKLLQKLGCHVVAMDYRSMI